MDDGTVAERIRDDIIDGRIALGERLRIDGLSVRYGVSHTPVREALRQLQGEGLVAIERHRGAQVRPLDAQLLRRIFAVRAAIEPMLVREAAAKMTGDALHALQAEEARLEELVAQEDYDAVLMANKLWHQRLYALAENPEAVATIDQHWIFLAAVWRRIGHPRQRFPTMVSDHRAILAALARGEAEDAAAITAAHVVRAKLLMLEQLDRLDAAPGDRKAG